jgi:predicted porin
MVAAGEGTVGNKYRGFRLGYAAGPVSVAVAYGRTYDLGAEDLKAANIGGSFNAGFATFMAQYHKYDFGASNQKNYLLGAAVPLGAGTFKISYGKAKGDGAGSGDASQVALGYVYDLSKRTSVYGAVARISNDAGSRFVTSGSGPNNPITGQNSTGYEVGVKHSF